MENHQSTENVDEIPNIRSIQNFQISCHPTQYSIFTENIKNIDDIPWESRPGILLELAESLKMPG